MRRNLAPVLWVLALGILPAAIYGWYFLNQKDRIAELNQRELGRAAENLRTLLANSVKNVQNLRSNPKSTCEVIRRQNYLSMPKDQACSVHDDLAGKKSVPTNARLVDGAFEICADSDFCFQVSLQKVLDELLTGDFFEYLFVADDTGRVLFQTRRGERQHWMDNLRWINSHLKDDSIEPVLPIRLVTVPARTGDQQNTAAVPFEVAGQRYQMYLQPVPNPKPDAQRIFLGGMVNARANVTAALAVEPRFALALIALLGMAVLSWPVLKIVVLAPMERFSFADVLLLLLCGAALVGVFTIVFLDADAAMRLKQTSSARLQHLADTISTDLEAELDAATGQLAEYDRQSALDEESCASDTVKEETLLLTNRHPKPLGLDPPAKYLRPASIFWVARDGMQFAKSAPGKANTPPVNVSIRPYFQAARDGDLWEFAGKERDARRFYTQTYRSVTTGDFETGISMRSKVACEDEESRAVVVLTTTLTSLSPKALPADYGFMLIDRSGRVLYHSDPRRGLREDLFEEVSEGARLRSIVLADQEASFTANYGTGPHELYVRPFRAVVVHNSSADPIGWYVVAFRDLQLTRTVNIEAVFSALVWAGLYFLATQAIPIAFLMARKPRRIPWLWPDGEKAVLYRRLATDMTLTGLLGGAAVALGDGRRLIAISGVIGGLAMAAAFWEYRIWGKHKLQDHALSRYLKGIPDARMRIVCIAVLFVPVSMMPAAGLFRFTWNDEVRRLLAYEEKHVRERTTDLQAAIEENAGRQFADAYGPNWEGVHKQFIEPQKAAVRLKGFPAVSRPAVGGPEWLAEWKAVYNEASAQLRYQSLEREIPSGYGMGLGWFTLFGIAALFACMTLWIRYWDKRLLLSGVLGAKTSVAEAVQAAWAKGKGAIVVARSRQKLCSVLSEVQGQAKAAAAGGGEGQSQNAVLWLDPDEFPCDRMANHSLVLAREDPRRWMTGGLPAPDRQRWIDTLEGFAMIQPPPEEGDPYAPLWDSCSEEEKLVLTHVAAEGFANPKQGVVTERLLKRGLLKRDPDLLPYCEGFRGFILEHCDCALVDKWEQPADGMGWSRARWIFMLLLVTLAVFLMATQKEALNPIVSFVPTVAGAVTALLKLVGDLSPRSKGAGAS